MSLLVGTLHQRYMECRRQHLGMGVTHHKAWHIATVNRSGTGTDTNCRHITGDALTIAMKQYGDKNYAGFYNVGPDDRDCITTGQLVELFCLKWGDNMKWINQYDGGPHEANFLKLDCSKIKRVFGWRPRWGVKEAIEKTIEWSKVYFEKGNIPECMDRQIKEFFEG